MASFMLGSLCQKVDVWETGYWVGFGLVGFRIMLLGFGFLVLAMLWSTPSLWSSNLSVLRVIVSGRTDRYFKFRYVFP